MGLACGRKIILNPQMNSDTIGLEPASTQGSEMLWLCDFLQAKQPLVEAASNVLLSDRHRQVNMTHSNDGQCGAPT